MAQRAGRRREALSINARNMESIYCLACACPGRRIRHDPRTAPHHRPRCCRALGRPVHARVRRAIRRSAGFGLAARGGGPAHGRTSGLDQAAAAAVGPLGGRARRTAGAPACWRSATRMPDVSWSSPVPVACNGPATCCPSPGGIPGRWKAASTRFEAPPEGSLQMLWANMLLHQVADPQALIAHWHRTLAVDGFLMFSCFGPDTPARTARVVPRTGLAGASARIHRHARLG
jgi:hypothetical protein